MIATSKKIFEINATMRTNTFLYRLKRLWPFSKWIPNGIYRYTDLKIALNYILAIAMFFVEIAKKFLYVFVCIYLPVQTVKGDSALTFLTLFVFLNLIIGAFSKSHLMEYNMKHYYVVNQLKMHAKTYALIDLTVYLIKGVLTFIPALIVVCLLCKVPLYLVPLLLLLWVCMKGVGEAWSLSYYEKKETVFITTKWNNYFGLGLPFVILVFLLAAKQYVPLHPIMLLPAVAVVLISIYAFSYIKKTDIYTKFYRLEMTKRKVMQDENAMMVVKKQSQMNITTTVLDEKTVSKTGFDYFNTVFFERHRKIVTQSVKWISFICLAVVVAFIFVLLLFPGARVGVNKYLLTGIPYFVLIMYFINRGEVISKAMFFNCDSSMLTYRFYRTPQNLLKNFYIRLRLLIGLNLIPAFIIGVGLSLLLYISGGTTNGFTYISLVVSILFLSIFFSVHYLVVYYLLQPYDIDMQLKSYAFSIVNVGTYMLCYFCSELKFDTFYFSMGAIFFSVIYTAVAYVLIQKFAVKTFKLK